MGDTGEFLAISVHDDAIVANGNEQKARIRDLELGVRAFAIRNHRQHHDAESVWDRCPMTSCRELKAMLGDKHG